MIAKANKQVNKLDNIVLSRYDDKYMPEKVGSSQGQFGIHSKTLSRNYQGKGKERNQSSAV